MAAPYIFYCYLSAFFMKLAESRQAQQNRLKTQYRAQNMGADTRFSRSLRKLPTCPEAPTVITLAQKTITVSASEQMAAIRTRRIIFLFCYFSNIIKLLLSRQAQQNRLSTQ